MKKMYFMPLGGGQRVGASCYYLNFGELHILLDAGIGTVGGLTFEPNTYSLITSPLVQSLGQITHIFISHAHSDHVGYLLNLMGSARNAMVYMTKATKLLTEYQLYERAEVSAKKADAMLAARMLLEKIIEVSYAQTIELGGGCRASFYAAGHIPGATMTLFEYGGKQILYTGDYSVDDTPLTGSCVIPDGLDLDSMIMCGLHAKHPDYRKKADAIYHTVDYVLRRARSGASVMCVTQQLSKGVEFLQMLNERGENIPIYIDDSVMALVRKLEQLSIPLLKANDHSIGGDLPDEPHILLTARPDRYRFYEGRYERVNVIFSLHEDFEQMKSFIKKTNPRHAYIVHAAPENSPFDLTIEQILMRDGECRTQFIFAEEGEIYTL